MIRTVTAVAFLFLAQLSPAYSETVMCGPWIVDDKPHGSSVSIKFDDQQMAWTDGHVRFAVPKADETQLGRIYVGKGEVYFAYVEQPQSSEENKSFKPSKVVRIPKDSSSVRYLTLTCGDK